MGVERSLIEPVHDGVHVSEPDGEGVDEGDSDNDSVCVNEIIGVGVVCENVDDTLGEGVGVATAVICALGVTLGDAPCESAGEGVSEADDVGIPETEREGVWPPLNELDGVCELDGVGEPVLVERG